MKKLILLISFFIITNISFSQYAKLEYWGKTVSLDRDFFVDLNNRYSYVVENIAPQYKYYDVTSYNTLFSKIVEFSKNPSNTWIIEMDNSLWWRGNIGINLDETKENKKNNSRFSLLAKEVVKSCLGAAAIKNHLK